MKTKKRALAFILSLAMILGVMPLGAITVSYADSSAPAIEAAFVATDGAVTVLENQGCIAIAATSVPDDVTKAGVVNLTLSSVLFENIISFTVSYIPAMNNVSGWEQAAAYTTRVAMTSTSDPGKSIGSFELVNNQIGNYTIIALTQGGSLTFTFEIVPDEAEAKFGSVYYTKFRDALAAANAAGLGELKVYKNLVMADYDANGSDRSDWGNSPKNDYDYETNNGWFFNDPDLVLNLNHHSAELAAAKNLTIRNAGGTVLIRYLRDRQNNNIPTINIESADAETKYELAFSYLWDEKDIDSDSAAYSFDKALLKGTVLDVDDVSVNESGVMAYSLGENLISVARTTAFPYGVATRAAADSVTSFAFYRTMADAFENSSDGLVYILTYENTIDPYMSQYNYMLLEDLPVGLEYSNLRTVIRRTDGSTSAFYVYDEASSAGVKLYDNGGSWSDEYAGDFNNAELLIASFSGVIASPGGVNIVGAGDEITENCIITESGLYKITGNAVNAVTVSVPGVILVSDAENVNIIGSDSLSGELYLSGLFSEVNVSRACLTIDNAKVKKLYLPNAQYVNISNSTVGSIVASDAYDFTMVNVVVESNEEKLVDFIRINASFYNTDIKSDAAKCGIYLSGSSLFLYGSSVMLTTDDAIGINAINGNLRMGEVINEPLVLGNSIASRHRDVKIVAEKGTGIRAVESGIGADCLYIKADDCGIYVDAEKNGKAEFYPSSLTSLAEDLGARIYANNTALQLTGAAYFLSVMSRPDQFVLNAENALLAATDSALGSISIVIPNMSGSIFAGTLTGKIIVAGEETSAAVLCAPYNIEIKTSGGTSTIRATGFELMEYLLDDSQDGTFVLNGDLELSSALYMYMMFAGSMSDVRYLEVYALLGIPVHGKKRVVDFNGHNIVSAAGSDGISAPFGLNTRLCTFFIEDGELQLINSAAEDASISADNMVQVIVLNGRFVNGMEDGTKGVDFLSSVATKSSIAILGALGQVELYDGEYRGLVINLLSDMNIHGGEYHGVLDAHFNMRYRGGKLKVYGGTYYNPTAYSRIISEFVPGEDTIYDIDGKYANESILFFFDPASLTENLFGIYVGYLYKDNPDYVEPFELFGFDAKYKYKESTEGAIQYIASLSSIFMPVATVYGNLFDAASQTKFIGNVMPTDAVLKLYNADGSENADGVKETVLTAGALGTYLDFGPLGIDLGFGLSTLSNTHSSYDSYMTVTVPAPQDNPGTGESGGSTGGGSVSKKKTNKAFVELADEKFKDVSSTDYFAEAVGWALDKKITIGVSEDEFAPASTCKRGEVVTFLWRAVGCPEPKTKENPFKDIKEDDYFYKAVLWAYENKITVGTEEDVFSPYETCSNAHILTFLYRAMIGKVKIPKDGVWYSDALKWAKSLDLLKGTYSVEFDVNADAPRANIVVYLYRYFE